MADELLQKTLEKAIVAFHKICDRIVYPENKCSKIHLADAALSTVIGGITFPLCLGFLQRGIFRPFRITSNLRVFSSLCGSISTIIAGSSASLAFLSSVLLLKEIKRNPLKTFAEKQPNRTVPVVVSSKDVPIYGVASLVVFKLLRGRFKSVLPSSLIHPGAFARRSLPAKGKNYASVGVKNKLAVMGEPFYYIHVQCIYSTNTCSAPVSLPLETHAVSATISGLNCAKHWHKYLIPWHTYFFFR